MIKCPDCRYKDVEYKVVHHLGEKHDYSYEKAQRTVKKIGTIKSLPDDLRLIELSEAEEIELKTLMQKVQNLKGKELSVEDWLSLSRRLRMLINKKSNFKHLPTKLTCIQRVKNLIKGVVLC